MTYEEGIEYENRLHARYFAPFDKILERKAEYYLEKTESEPGKKYDLLLEEIETLDRFRQYVDMLESIVQEQLTHMHRMGVMIEFWKEKYLEQVAFNKEQNDLFGLLINHAEKYRNTNVCT